MTLEALPTPLASWLSREGKTDAWLAAAVGVSRPIITRIRSGDRQPSQALAIRIYRATDGLKIGPISSATAEEISVLERFQGAA